MFASELMLINLVCSLYLCWKFKTGGFDILKPSNLQGGKVLGTILLFIGYVGFSIALVSVVGIIRIVTSVLLLVAAARQPEFWPLGALYVAHVVVMMGATYASYRSGIFNKKSK